jgi:chitodextrinase
VYTGTATVYLGVTPPVNNDTTPPTPPTLSGQTLSPTSITLSYPGATDNVGVLGYQIFRNGLSLNTTNSTSYTDSNLTPSTTYSYTVKAYDGIGNTSINSNSITITTPPITPPVQDTTPPTTPTLSGIATSPTLVSLSWTQSTDNVGVTGYELKRNGTLLSTSNTTTYSDSALQPSTTYTYTVRAFDAAGNYSNTTSTSISTPQQTSVSPTITYFTVSTPVISEGTLTFNFVTSNASSLSIDQGVGSVTNLASKTITAPSVLSTTTIVYTLTATNSNGSVGKKISTIITPAAKTTEVPQSTSTVTNLKATVKSWNEIELTWTPVASSSKATEYLLVRQMVSGRRAVDFLTFPITAQNYTDRSIIANAKYVYSIQTKSITRSGGYETLGTSDYVTATTNQTATVTPGKPTIINTCQVIRESGNYELNTDLAREYVSISGSGCITIMNTSNVSLDCKNHTIDAFKGVYVENVDTFKIVNCQFIASKGAPTTVYDFALELVVYDSKNGIISKNIIGELKTNKLHGFDLDTVDNILVDSNVANSYLILRHATNSTVSNNIVNGPLTGVKGYTYGELVGSALGSKNTFKKNIINGNAQWNHAESTGNPYSDYIGADDSLIISDETGDILSENVTFNNWDAGIEFAGTVDVELYGNYSYGNGVADIACYSVYVSKASRISGQQCSSK